MGRTALSTSRQCWTASQKHTWPASVSALLSISDLTLRSTSTASLHTSCNIRSRNSSILISASDLNNNSNNISKSHSEVRSFSTSQSLRDSSADDDARKKRLARAARRRFLNSANSASSNNLRNKLNKAKSEASASASDASSRNNDSNDGSQQEQQPPSKSTAKNQLEEDIGRQPQWWSEPSSKAHSEESKSTSSSSSNNTNNNNKDNENSSSKKKNDDDNNNQNSDESSNNQKARQGQPMPPGFDFNSKNFRVFEIKITPQHILVGFLLTIMAFSFLGQDSMANNEISWQEFKTEYLEKGSVRKITVVNRNTVYATTSFGSTVYFSIGSVDLFEKRMDDFQRNVPANERVPISYVEQGSLLGALFGFLPTLLLLGALYWMTRRPGSGSSAGGGIGGGIFGMGQSRAKLYNKATDVNVKFADVAGMDEAKEEIMEFVKFLKEPAKYEELGAKIPRGAILSGPPGTGKTLLAKATAGEAGVPFFSVSGSEFIEMFAGVGASRVRDLFKAARAKAPSIIFVDEIDAIGKARNKSFVSGGHDEREATLNQLLVEMDGFESSDHVVVLAGTNRADVLDPALLRPGRFDRHITIDRPDIEGRISIYKVHLKKIRYNENIPELSGKLAAMTPGFSGADIANVVNEAALIAARQESELVELTHFEQAIERVIAGLEKKSRVLVPEKKRVVAYHEAGHAVCGWFLKYADPLVKVSIIPRGSAALGYAQYLPPDQYLISEEQFKDKMAMSLGGRVSEEINFSSVTLGGSDDFKKVTQMAKAMVTQLGMSPKVGQIFYEQNQESITKPFSEHTGELIDGEIRRIVNEAHERCRALLLEKKEAVEIVAEELLKKEVIGREDMIRLLGPRPFPERNDAFDKYLSTTPQSDEHKHTDGGNATSPSPA